MCKEWYSSGCFVVAAPQWHSVNKKASGGNYPGHKILNTTWSSLFFILYMFLKIVAGQKKKKWPGQFTHNEKNNNFYTSPKICSENWFSAKSGLPARFGASRPSETDSLRKTDTIGSFFIENGATGADFGTKTCFLVPLSPQAVEERPLPWRTYSGAGAGDRRGYRAARAFAWAGRDARLPGRVDF